MAQYTVYETVTPGALKEALLKESVGDLISNLFPLDTPLQQVLGKMSMQSVFTLMPIDTFSTSLINRVSSVFAASSQFATTNAKPEGWTFTSVTPQYPARLKSVIEIQGSQFSVSDTDPAVAQYGMANRFAYEALKHTQALVNQVEHSLWWSPGTSEAGADLNSGANVDFQFARQTQGLIHWIGKSGLQRSKHGLGLALHPDLAGNQFGTTGGALNTGASAWAYDAGGLALDQSMFKDNLMAQWYSITGRQGGAVGFCGPKIKNLFSQFALTANGAINERTLAAAAKEVIDTVDTYTTDFGTVNLNLSRYLDISGQTVTMTTSSDGVTENTNTVVPYNEVLVFIKPSYFKIGVLRPVYMSVLGKTGDLESGLVRTEQGLICMNPQAGAMIVNCIP